MDLITAQLFDPESKIVPIVALSVLDEASDDKLNLEAMVCSLQNKDLDHLGKYFFLSLFFKGGHVRTLRPSETLLLSGFPMMI